MDRWPYDDSWISLLTGNSGGAWMSPSAAVCIDVIIDHLNVCRCDFARKQRLANTSSTFLTALVVGSLVPVSSNRTFSRSRISAYQ